jgi:threonine dehydratase
VIGLDDIRRATDAVYRVAHRTPILDSPSLTQAFRVPVLLKAECLQRTGSFKVRGAANKLATLSQRERSAGVIAASAGNHAQGVAVAARALGIAATIVMPETAPLSKAEATRSYGATVILHGDSYGEAHEHMERLAKERRLTQVPGYDDEAVIAGQGTLGLELAEDAPDAGLVLLPIGGGGLAAGVAVALKSLKPDIRVVGVQAAAAPAVATSLRRGRRTTVEPQHTLADGVAVPEPGRLTLPIIRRYVDHVVTVDEESIVHAVVLLLERKKLVVEGAGALAVAALLSGAVAPGDRPVVAVLSGGNIDMNTLASTVQHGLLQEGRYLTLSVMLEDQPGELAKLLSALARSGANLLDVAHHRQGVHMPLGSVEVRLLVETRGREHLDELVADLRSAGFADVSAPAPSPMLRVVGRG